MSSETPSRRLSLLTRPSSRYTIQQVIDETASVWLPGEGKSPDAAGSDSKSSKAMGTVSSIEGDLASEPLRSLTDFHVVKNEISKASKTDAFNNVSQRVNYTDSSGRGPTSNPMGSKNARSGLARTSLPLLEDRFGAQRTQRLSQHSRPTKSSNAREAPLQSNQFDEAGIDSEPTRHHRSLSIASTSSSNSGILTPASSTSGDEPVFLCEKHASLPYSSTRLGTPCTASRDTGPQFLEPTRKFCSACFFLAERERRAHVRELEAELKNERHLRELFERIVAHDTEARAKMMNSWKKRESISI